MEFDGRTGSRVTARLFCEDRVNGTMPGQCQCPNCGYVIDLGAAPEDDPGAVIESQRLEIRLLRETIAGLRGSLGWQATRLR
jgi:hypothetical protein